MIESSISGGRCAETVPKGVCCTVAVAMFCESYGRVGRLRLGAGGSVDGTEMAAGIVAPSTRDGDGVMTMSVSAVEHAASG